MTTMMVSLEPRDPAKSKITLSESNYYMSLMSKDSAVCRAGGRQMRITLPTMVEASGMAPSVRRSNEPPAACAT